MPDALYLDLESDIQKDRNSIIGNNMRAIRTKANKTQEDVAKAMFIDRSTYSRYENGKQTPNEETVLLFAKFFNIPPDALEKSIAAVIPDTSALLKNRHLLTMLLHDFGLVVIPRIIISELDRQKDYGKFGTQRAAWQTMMSIREYETRFPDRLRVVEDMPGEGKRNDERILETARALDKELNCRIYVVHDDIGMSLSSYERSLLLRDYIARRTHYTDYNAILDLNCEYHDFSRFAGKELDLDVYLPDGNTLLINAIRRSPQDSVALSKIQFLLRNGASPDRTDNNSYCLTPLAHCVQTRNYAAFCLLLDHGADYNKGSVDELNSGHLKQQLINEGNTPLMIACWHGLPKFAKKLCSLPKICLNQQDSNGYTALIKCAVQRVERVKKHKPFKIQKDLYRMLLSKPSTDPLIRDRQNRTAEDWWKIGDALLREEGGAQ